MSGASMGGRVSRVRGLLHKGVRGAAGSVLALSVVLAGSTPALANVEGEMNSITPNQRIILLVVGNKRSRQCFFAYISCRI